jgi:O-antigen ligase
MNKQMLKGAIFVGLFALPFVPFFISSSLFFPFITTKAFAFRIIVEVIFAAWALLALIDAEYRPKRGAVLWALAAFLGVVGLATIFSVEPVKSFWSNFERMEGYVTMLHLGALFLVMSSFFKEKEWKWWWNTTLSASALMVVYCLFQLMGALEIHQGGVRVDGTLGNAAYLALYFLIHIFIAGLFLFRAKASSTRLTYGLLMLGQIFILYSTATRGAILGLLGGLFIVAILNVTNKDLPAQAGSERARKWSRVLLGGLVALIAIFFLVRDTSFVQNSQTLARFANLNLTSWKTEGRAFVWPMAVEGIKERPLLGWGQENFNYVFAEHYQAEMYRLEPWFDRAHNIFLDWGISAGLLGLGAYLSLYIVLLITIWKDGALSRMERSILTGLIAAYFFNNLFVFDNLVSYTLFIALLAYVHSQVALPGEPSSALGREGKSRPIALPAALITIVALGVIYFVNIKPIIANTSLIGALQTVQMGGGQAPAMSYFRKAYEASRLGRPEVVEWMSSSAGTVLGDESVPMAERNEYFTFARDAVEGMAEELGGDPRYEIVAGNFLLSTGQLDAALAHFERAREIMPEKQAILFNIGQVLYYNNERARALEVFKQAYDLAPENENAKNLYEAARKEVGL